jgi:hypothetical protein
MRKPKLIEDYHYLNYDAISPFARSVARQVQASTFIANAKVLVNPLESAVAALDANVAGNDHPTPADTAQRDLVRAVAITELGRLAKRLNLDYPGNEPALLSSGLPLAGSTSGAGDSAALSTDRDEVMAFELLDGAQPGCLLLKLKRPTGTIQNLIRYTTEATLSEDQRLVAVGGGRERQLGPFASGTKVYVKAAALTGSTTEPQYAAVKSRIVQ